MNNNILQVYTVIVGTLLTSNHNSSFVVCHEHNVKNACDTMGDERNEFNISHCDYHKY